MEKYLKIRHDWGMGDAKRDEGLKTPADIERIDNVRYGAYGDENLLDIYYPKNTVGKLPVIISVHGGAYVYGSKEIYQFYGMSLAQRGYAFVNFNYRLAPESKFPAQLEDIDAVVRFVFENADRYPFDVRNIFMLGDSAGANLLGLYLCSILNPEYAKISKIKKPIFDGEVFLPNAVAFNCGIYDTDEAMKEDTERVINNEYLLGEPAVKGLSGKYLNVVDYMTKDFPPVYVMSAYYDFLKGQVPCIEKKIKELGIENVIKVYGDESTKDLMHVFHVNQKLPAADVCNDDECEFFRKYMK